MRPLLPVRRELRKNFADILEADLSDRSVLHAAKDRPSIAQCYLNPTPHESDPASFTTHQTPILASTTAAATPLFKYTDPIALPNVGFN